MNKIHCDGVMSAEGNLYNPGIFNTEHTNEKDKIFPRVDKLLREYFEIVKSCEGSHASKIAMKSHFFKILRPFLPLNTDIRSNIATMKATTSFNDWEEKVVKLVEERVQAIFNEPNIYEKDVITVGKLNFGAALTEQCHTGDVSHISDQ